MTSYDLTTMTEVHPAVISEGDLIQIQFNSSTIWQTHEKIVNIFSMPFNIHHYITSIQKESCYLCQRTELHTLLRRRLCARHISNHALSLHIDMYYMFEEELPSVDKYFNPNNHKEICVALRNVLKSHPQFWHTYGLTLEKWVRTRKQFMCLVKLELQRDLKPHEVQIITLAKSCAICYRQDNLLSCPQCYSINYCKDHEKLLGNRHKFNCNILSEYYRVDTHLSSYITLESFTSLTHVLLEDFPPSNFPRDMDTFIEKYMYANHVVDFPKFNLSEGYYFSDYLSGPFTLYNGIRKITGLDFHTPDLHIVIHVIDVNFVDRYHLLIWQVLRHILRNIKELKIILIGSELSTESLKFHPTKYSQQRLNFETHRMLYHNYVDSEYYKRPDIIVGFQVDLSNWEALSEIILKIKAQECPFLLTSKSKDKAEQNINKIKEILKSTVTDVLYLIYNGENKFKSNRPYHDFETGGLSYLNKYLTVYARL
ncbi:uncharacterized protein LOC116844051 isoform X2 [Odontomachus brunneus]|uniref:uncharacterized protein LOC116844051 isoform X2 n=1 Tax=Odontomachus brunneus TaxID=486640 RepID=UPI0013F1906D|nr:uncharacterized protein LOC116844051 isoform X2 [Odontomachus brunneus]